MSPRVPGLRPEEMDGDQRKLYESIAGGPRADGPFRLLDDDGSLLGPFDAMVRAPELGRAVQEVGVQLRFAGALTDREREMVILTVAEVWRSGFEWYAHEAVVRAGELCDESDLAAIAEGSVPPSCTARESAVVDAARELVIDRRIADETYARLENSGLSTAEIVELSVCVGYYAMLAGMLESFDIAAPVGFESPWND